jgi:MOSC domain-containing protein YiiM
MAHQSCSIDQWAGSECTAGHKPMFDEQRRILLVHAASEENPVGRGKVTATCRSSSHSFSKSVQPSITLLAGLGVEGDAHRGVTVKHRSRVRKDPTAPNLRQVHLIQEELIDELRAAGYRVGCGVMGENISTRGLDLLCLPRGAKLHIGREVVLEVTGLRNPCRQLDDFQSGLLSAVLDRDAAGNLIRKAGVMSIVLVGGEVRPDDHIDVELARLAFVGLEPV